VEQEGGTVRENVTISYRGANYELGRGRQFYGIWPVGAPSQAPPLEWWPETTEGWYGAWARFTGIEAPGTIAPVAERAAPVRGFAGAPDPDVQPGPAGIGGIVAAGLLGLGVLLGIVGLFPHYVGGESLAHAASDLVPHLIYLAAWAGGALLILLGGRRLLVGALLAAGTSIVTFGLFFADLGTATSGGGHGAGLDLSLVGWLLCAVGAVVGFRLRPSGRPARPGAGAGVLTLVVGTLAALGAAAAFAPSWDRYSLHTAAGAAQTVTAGNAFSNPGLVITGDVLVMIALVITAVAAVAWRPARLGAVLLAGALVPMVAQAISAIIQIAQGASPEQFGISSAQAAAAGLTISSGLTAAFWIYCIFLIGLIATCIWLLVQARVPAGPATVRPPVGPSGALPPVAPMNGPSAGGTAPLPAGHAAPQPVDDVEGQPASAPPAPPAENVPGQADTVAESVPSAAGQGPSQP
jgi:hypothetical protein